MSKKKEKPDIFKELCDVIELDPEDVWGIVAYRDRVVVRWIKGGADDDFEIPTKGRRLGVLSPSEGGEHPYTPPRLQDYPKEDHDRENN